MDRPTDRPDRPGRRPARFAPGLRLVPSGPQPGELGRNRLQARSADRPARRPTRPGRISHQAASRPVGLTAPRPTRRPALPPRSAPPALLGPPSRRSAHAAAAPCAPPEPYSLPGRSTGLARLLGRPDRLGRRLPQRRIRSAGLAAGWATF
nr:uncharacterized protein LOC127339877 [Lolium perenne]